MSYMATMADGRRVFVVGTDEYPDCIPDDPLDVEFQRLEAGIAERNAQLGIATPECSGRWRCSCAKCFAELMAKRQPGLMTV